MLSAEKERIPFDKVIDPKGKNVEDWMTEVEEQMKLSVRTVLLQAIRDYKTMKREDWILEHAGQCVLNGSQVHWTAEVEQSIKAAQVHNYF
jgi:dynein heavy chain